MRRGRNLLLVVGSMLVLAAGALLAPANAAETLSTEQVEKIVRDYLMREPEIVYQALQELQKRQAAAKAEQQKAAIVKYRAKLTDEPGDPIAGAEPGGVTLVEFFDYRCTYCRRVVDSVQAMLDEQKDLRVVFKEFPVLGEDSVRAARAALASRRQDRYLPFHFALMRTDDLSPAGIRAAATSVGLDPERLEQDMEAPEITQTIERNYSLASALGIDGTPAFVIGDALIPGAVDKARLVELIEEARTGCVSC